MDLTKKTLKVSAKVRATNGWVLSSPEKLKSVLAQRGISNNYNALLKQMAELDESCDADLEDL